MTLALSLRAPPKTVEQHIGYYLVDKGRTELEKELGCCVPVITRLHRVLRERARQIYFAGVLCCSLACIAALATAIDVRYGALQVACLLLMALPAIRIGSHLTQFLMGGPWFRPRRLPRLALAAGVPVESRTAVILPVIIGSLDDLEEATGTLEKNFLRAQDRNLAFFLLTDLQDATEPELPGDARLLREINARIHHLNSLHGSAQYRPFHHLHRCRVFNERDQLWMGWERKRGKIIEFCRFLRGDAATSFVSGSLRPAPRDFTYAITLDADSILEPGGAIALIGILSHPLNQPRLVERTVFRGYAVVSPRIAPAPEQASSAFFAAMYRARMAAKEKRLLPSFYQDFFDEDMFGGKGVMCLRAFAECVNGRIPENRVLSHDHLEGIFAKAGFASDVLLYEEFPTSVVAWRRRQHRWIRGDTQVSLWILPRIPAADGGWTRSTLSALDRWKLFGNLLSHTSPVLLLFAALLAWLGVAGENGGPAGVIALMLIGSWMPLSAISAAALKPLLPLTPADATSSSDGVAIRARNVFNNVRNGTAGWIVTIVLLLDNAVIVCDAIARSLYRLLVSGRKLLEWNTAASVRTSLASLSVSKTWVEMKWAPILATLIALGIWQFRPENLPWALPFLLVWFASPQIAFHASPPTRKAAERAPLPAEAQYAASAVTLRQSESLDERR